MFSQLWCNGILSLLQCITYPYQTGIAAIVHDSKHLPIKNPAPFQKILETQKGKDKER